MNLTLDANILLDELTREGGASNSLLMHPALGTLFIAQFTWDEAMHVLDNRLNSWMRRQRLSEADARLFEAATKTFAGSRCTVVPETFYGAYETEARRRIPDDPDDWHTAALSLMTGTAVWTLDQKHFFGCGLAVWKSSIPRHVLIDA